VVVMVVVVVDLMRRGTSWKLHLVDSLQGAHLSCNGLAPLQQDES